MDQINGCLNLNCSFGDYKRSKELGYHWQMITYKPDILTF